MFKKFDFIEKANLKNFSTIKIGGKAKYVIFPKNHLEIAEIFKICEQNALKVYILGNGSNILFDDAGFDGVLIHLKHFQKIKQISDDRVFVGAGINLFMLNQKLKNMGLGGLEWSYGIPATLGGFVAMNGGCFGHEICEFVEKLLVFDNGRIKLLRKNEVGFSYRFSSLKGNVLILGVWLKLIPKEQIEIEKEMQVFFQKKKNSQPCEFPSLGSVFKQIRNGDEIIYPAKLIDNMGLKGVKIGRAQISQKHAGFIVNLGGATSDDFCKLAHLIEEKLKEIGIYVQKEIIYLR